jgi:hypothetical protein
MDRNTDRMIEMIWDTIYIRKSVTSLVCQALQTLPGNISLKSEPGVGTETNTLIPNIL